MTLDLTPVIQALATLVLAVVVPTIPYAVVLIQRHTGIKLTDQQTAAITGAADQGANLAYGWLVTQAASVAQVPMKNVALAVGVNHVLASVPDALKAIGITPDHVSAMVEARLGGLLAADPTVSVAAAIATPDTSVSVVAPAASQAPTADAPVTIPAPAAATA